MSAALPWFRLYVRTIDDTKLKLLAFEDRWHFIALLCLKASGLIDKPAGDIRDRQIAIALGVDVPVLSEIGRRLREVGLVDEAFQPVAWDALQFKSDNSTARVQAFRNRTMKRSKRVSQRFGNVSETAQETEQNRAEQTEAEASSSTETFDASDFVESWNETADAVGLPKIAKLTAKRRQSFNARRREFPDIEDWRRAFHCLRHSPFLLGEGPSGWRANPDFFLQPSSFTKLVEGAYEQAR